MSGSGTTPYSLVFSSPPLVHRWQAGSELSQDPHNRYIPSGRNLPFYLTVWHFFHGNVNAVIIQSPTREANAKGYALALLPDVPFTEKHI